MQPTDEMRAVDRTTNFEAGTSPSIHALARKLDRR